MLIFFGVHRKRHVLSTQHAVCTACGRSPVLDFILVKHALHFFYVPFMPVGSAVYLACPACSYRWKAPNAPFDHTFWAFAPAALILFMLTFALGIDPVLGKVWWITGIATIVLSTVYLFFLPSHFIGFPAGRGSFPGYPVVGQAVPETNVMQGPPARHVPAEELYAADYAARATCARCGLRYDSSKRPATAGCPYCGDSPADS